MKTLSSTLLVLFISIASFGQQMMVKGTVTTASDGLPLPGATVLIKGTSNGTQTDFDGKFTIQANYGDIITVSYVAMDSAEFIVNGQEHYEVSLTENALDEVVVVGYGITTRRAYAGSSVISSGPTKAQIRRQNKRAYQNKLAGQIQSNSINQSLQGEVSGVTIVEGSDKSKEASKILIRGFGSINGNNKPLYIVDGVISDENLNNVSPNDINNITVLKDASATSIYGSRGANGVIVVSTKGESNSKKEPLYIVDGKPINKINNHIVESIPETDIESKKVYDQKDAKDKFGKIAKHGCIVITTQKGNFRCNNESYAVISENSFERTLVNPLSTFSIDVDKASYSNVRRLINNGNFIEPDAVKIEEMINYFDYDYPQPEDQHPFSISSEVVTTPWHQDTNLVRIGLQGKIYENEELPASNLTFLIDVSGSMGYPNKLPLLKSAFKLLVNQLREKDKVSIVVYAGSAGLVLEPTRGNKKDKILAALNNLDAGGSTAGGEGINLAYKIAQENFIKNGNNRVILATDGDFNVGASTDREMQTLIEEKRKSGVFLSVLGFGYGNYKDSKLETLADKGNGNHAYIDNMQEAQKVFEKEFGGTLFTIAKDVKIQIEFNPNKVQAYRLIGYENRLLADEDFVDDTKDAGELGSGHTVTALYEVIPVGVESSYLSQIPELKYVEKLKTSDYNDELFTVKFRYKKPQESKSIELVHIQDTEVSKLSEDMYFASAVALFGMKLRQSKYDNNANLAKIIELGEKGRGDDKQGYRAEFLRLVKSYNYIQ